MWLSSASYTFYLLLCVFSLGDPTAGVSEGLWGLGFKEQPHLLLINHLFSKVKQLLFLLFCVFSGSL